jgi:probable H4MPT-linked C1 transfer pathway protein
VVQCPCPLWQGLSFLDAAIADIIVRLGPVDRHAVTMTGEMVDLFPDRAAGVRALVEHIERRFQGAEVRYYSGGGGFVDGAGAVTGARAVASANWQASAAVVGATLQEGLLLDIGSTTTDVIPVLGGQCVASGDDDYTRLVAGELVYTGVVRTPVMALAARVPFGGDSVPLMAEYFATAADIHRLCGTLPEGADQHPAADGGEKTAEGSARRLARMIGRDAGSRPHLAWVELAHWLVGAQRSLIDEASDRVVRRAGLAGSAPLVRAGVGRYLVPALAVSQGRRVVEFGSLLAAEPGLESAISDCAPAAAVAWLRGSGSS